MKDATSTNPAPPDIRSLLAEEARTRRARTAQALEFLRLLWGPTPPPGFVVTWWKGLDRNGSASFPAADLDKAASAAIESSDLPTGPGRDFSSHLGREVYFGTCLQAEEPEWGRRGTASGACAIPGLWADLDVAGPAHKSPNLPPTKEAAADLARRAPWPPSVLVDSGNGLQAWWLFSEPLLLQTNEDRKRAGDLVARLQDCLRQNPEGWEVDSTADLARVLRLPGTWNRKLQHRAEDKRRELADKRQEAKALSGPPPRLTGSKWDPTAEELESRPARAEQAAREAADLARELEALEAAGTEPRPVRVLEVTGERHSPEEWDAALPQLVLRGSAPGPSEGSACHVPAPSGNGKRASSPGRPSLEERAARYLETLGPAVQGQGGDAHTARAAWAVAVEFGLEEPVARRVLQDWDRGNRPPWQDTEPEGLEGKLRSALAKAPGHPDLGRLAEEDRPAPGGAKVIPIRQEGRRRTKAPPSSGAVALAKDRDEDKDHKPTQGERLLRLAAEACFLFRTPEGEAHVTVKTRTRQETWPVQSRMLASWLRIEFLEKEGRLVGADALKQAVDTLEAKALHGADVREVYVRSASAGGKVILDLADTEGRAVVIGPDGWEVTRTPPVAFRRPKDQRDLPVPSRQGSWDDLRPLMNLDEDGWVLFVGWLVGALSALPQYPVLIVEGAQGSAKSSLAKAARALIDPSDLDVQEPPAQKEDIHIRAGNSLLLAYDNLSSPPRWLSDTLCVLSTGGGFSVRAKYTNREEAIFRAARPIILTGIEGLARGDDLANRAILLDLADIPDERRIPEEDWQADLEEARPRILGALCDAISGGLALREKARQDARNAGTKLPRPADFSLFVLAAEDSGALPWGPGRFLEAMSANRKDASELGVERDFLASTIYAWLETKGKAASWEGTAQALLDELHAFLADDERGRKKLPGAANSLGGKLRRIAPMLRSAGVLYEPSAKKPGRNPRTHALRLEPEPASEPERELPPDLAPPQDLFEAEEEEQFEEVDL